jgi:sugar phosphate isomerase/epimerase
MVYNRFQKDPGLREQLDGIVAALPAVVQAAEQAGIVLAFENHSDYRVSEVVEIIERVGSSSLRLLFDIGNTFAVAEDPLEAAKIAAPYTVLVHVKDVVVLPFTPATHGYFACMYVCPLGEGNVDILGIVDHLAAHAPNPDTLALSIEMAAVAPHVDEELWVEKGIEWMRNNLSHHITETTQISA